MIKKLKIFVLALLFTGATVIAARAQTPPYAVENLSVHLIATYSFQDPATTNDRTGTITDKIGKVTIDTPTFLALLADNLGITLKKGASLIKVTELGQGVNYTNVITNSTTTNAGYTFLETNLTATNFVYENLTTNGPAFVTNSTPQVPAGYEFYSNGGAPRETNLVQALGDSVIVGTNVQFYLNNGPGLVPANFLPLIGNTNNNAGATITIGDDATSFLRNSVMVDSYVVTFETNVLHHSFSSASFSNSLGLLTNFFLAQGVTNHSVFAGTIKTNFAITGTLYRDSISVVVGPPNVPIGTMAPPQLDLNGSANATAVTADVISNHIAMPFTSWNAAFAVTGGGSLGAIVTNTVTTNLVYASNGMYLTFNYAYLYDYYSTNPPIPYVLVGPYYFDGTNSIGYTNVATNYYTNFAIVSGTATNTSFTVTGGVVQTFWKIVQ
jgi:hypothetical protein